MDGATVDGGPVAATVPSSVEREVSFAARPGRCPGCLMPAGLCYCDAVHRLETATAVTLLVDRRELALLSNTARIAHASLRGSRLMVRDRREQSPRFPELRLSGRIDLLLFPDETADDLATWAARHGASELHLVVPDATWSVARRMTRRLADLATLPRVRVRPAARSRYRLRSTPHRERLATFEALIEALALLEGPRVREPLLANFERHQRAVLEARYGKGRTCRPEQEGVDED